MALLFKPFGLLAGFAASRLASSIFDRVWQRVDGQPLPDVDVREDTAGRVVAARVLQSSIFAATSVLVSRYGMHVYEHAFGSWPGKHRELEDS